MSIRDFDVDSRDVIPPYGPTKGTIQALQMLRRTTPTRIDSDFLRVNKLAPGNEYKVVGALKFLGLIDNEGRPTDGSRLLKTKGATYTLALQDIVRNAYTGVFHTLRHDDLTRDSIYNYFVTDGGLGAEMATKATRFLLKLCRLAEIEIGQDRNLVSSTGGRRKSRAHQQTPRRPQSESVIPQFPQAEGSTLPFVLTMTPELANMDVAQLTELFRKMRIAIEQSQST